MCDEKNCLISSWRCPDKRGMTWPYSCKINVGFRKLEQQARLLRALGMILSPILDM